MTLERWKSLPMEIRARNLIRVLRAVEDGADPATAQSTVELCLCDPEWQVHNPALVSLATTLSADPFVHTDFLAAFLPIEAAFGMSRRDGEFLAPFPAQAHTDRLPLVAVLCDLRSAFNVGAILRTAGCLGLERVEMAGYTPTPAHPKVRHTAMGSDLFTPWAHRADERTAIQTLREEGRYIYALETGGQSHNLFEVPLRLPCAVLAGNEARGLPPDTLSQVDEVLAIPMAGYKLSLNVGVAFAITAMEFRRRAIYCE